MSRCVAFVWVVTTEGIAGCVQTVAADVGAPRATAVTGAGWRDDTGRLDLP